MNIEPACLNLDYMELDEEERLTEGDALMLGVMRDIDEEESSSQEWRS